MSARAAAGSGSPVTIMSIARSAPTSRGRRWVPSGSREETELDLRQAELRVRTRDPIVRGHRQLETAAETGAADRRDDRLGAGLHSIDELAQGRVGGPRGRAELPDVGAAGEEAAGAGEDDGADGRVGQRTLEGRGDAGADSVGETVDGWVGEGDDRDGAVDSVAGLGGHLTAPAAS